MKRSAKGKAHGVKLKAESSCLGKAIGTSYIVSVKRKSKKKIKPLKTRASK